MNIFERLWHDIMIWRYTGNIGVAAYHTYGRKLSAGEVAKIDQWMKGVSRKMDELGDELSKMPNIK